MLQPEPIEEELGRSALGALSPKSLNTLWSARQNLAKTLAVGSQAEATTPEVREARDQLERILKTRYSMQNEPDSSNTPPTDPKLVDALGGPRWLDVWLAAAQAGSLSMLELLLSRARAKGAHMELLKFSSQHVRITTEAILSLLFLPVAYVYPSSIELHLTALMAGEHGSTLCMFTALCWHCCHLVADARGRQACRQYRWPTPPRCRIRSRIDTVCPRD
jgi:hypothetical protein